MLAGDTMILHADVDAFYASVAQRDDPGLRGRPVVVGGGVVMAASYEARNYGVRGGMGGARARRLCPDLVVAKPSWSAYVDAGKAVFAVFEQIAPVVEAVSIEEAFLDISGLPGSPRDRATRLRAEVREQVGLSISVGVGRTKIVAKMASRAAKPDGLLVVPGVAERAFLDALRVEELWGVGPTIAARLHEQGIRTVGQVAELAESTLIAILGTGSGRHLHALAHNRDRSPVRANLPRRSFGAQRALGRAGPPDDLDGAVAGLVDRVTRRMQEAGRAGRTVLLRLRFADYTRATRSRTLAAPTAEAETILAAARLLLAEAIPMIERQGLTLLGITVENLTDATSGMQLQLPVQRSGPP